MTVIALTQEMGSLAKDVAEQLAGDLGLAVMRHEVVDNVAEPDARADEPDPPAARRQGRRDRAPARRPGEPRGLHRPRRCSTPPRAATSSCAAGARPACCARCRTSSASASRGRSTQRVAWLLEQLGTDDIALRRGRDPAQRPRPRGAHARAVRRRPGATRCSTTSSSTPTASRSRAASQQIAALARAARVRRDRRRRGRCCRTWRSTRASAPRCAPTKRRATSTSQSKRRRPRRPAAASSLTTPSELPAAERVARAVPGVDRRRQPADA